ncbi:type V CRISPR-associated protein Cas12k [Geminocystis sp. NIES-3709]|uniref:type V CRISPR-associated protein Cas12k n=1 Tax=Geminocystis sp. NIES-3709 TaxID=1617448 RepID=UPI0005FCA5A4|nr:type V CRISPR-associated protein Cas12k [Geminocystis sp. NIES-3709]BAQ63841.1 hypothetical protein GM3709_606 [Geminocystis sp. NIES-3709]
MAHVTIQCRLIASRDTRQFLWQLMAQKNTPLINEILLRIKQHPDFPHWRTKKRLPKDFLARQIAELKNNYPFEEQPSRFYASVNKVIDYIYKSWFEVQKALDWKLQGNLRWVEMLLPDTELIKHFDNSLESLQQQATLILDSIDSTVSHDRISTILFEKCGKTKKPEIKSAIIYLLKNGCTIPKKPETTEKYQDLKRKVEIKITKLHRQIESRIPLGRDLEDKKWLDTLITASTTAPIDQTEANTWFSILKQNQSSIPYPILYETNEDLKWSLNEKNRLSIRFSGLGEHSFQLCCDHRQLPYFQRFYEDQELKKASKDQLSSALFTLRSAMILWKEDEGKGELWDRHKLYLHCTFETRCLTAEGTSTIVEEKQKEVTKIIDLMKAKEELSDSQQAFIRRKNSTLAKLNNTFPRPSKPVYQGKPNVHLGIAMGLEQPVTIAIVDIETDKVITYRNTKQLLREDYRLLRRRRIEKQKLSHQNHKARKRFNFQQKGESNLGEYLDRLIAKAILTVAQEYQVSTILIPRLRDMRSITEAEIQLRAEKKIPEYKEGQKKYAQDYRVQVHQWSYGRLIENVKLICEKVGIVVVEAKQPKQGTLTEKALQLVLSATEKNLKKK